MVRELVDPGVARCDIRLQRPAPDEHSGTVTLIMESQALSGEDVVQIVRRVGAIGALVVGQVVRLGLCRPTLARIRSTRCISSVLLMSLLL